MQLSLQTSVQIAALAEYKNFTSLLAAISRSDGFVFVSGTYWDSWGSPLQRFLEEATPLEGTAAWLGKPAAVAVLMHSVGGKGMLSRLQGVLNTLGLLIPPMSGLVYSAVNAAALAQTSSKICQDLWCMEDLEVLCHNLLEACAGGSKWRSWPSDKSNDDTLWLCPSKVRSRPN